MKTLYYTLYLIILTISTSFAQIGINQPTPDASAVLELKNVDKARGLLIPRITTQERTSMETPVNSLLVFDTDENRFFFYDAASKGWIFLDPWTREERKVNELIDSKKVTYILDEKVGIGTNEPTEKLEINGTTKATNMEILEKTSSKSADIKELVVNSAIDIKVTNKVKAETLEGYGTIPIGGIIPWSGNIDTLDTDTWALCDGTNDTPNLSGRFIVGYDSLDSDYDAIGKPGGSIESVTHSHPINITVFSQQTDTTNVDESKYIYKKYKEIQQNSKFTIPGLGHNHWFKYVIEEASTDEAVIEDKRPPYYVLAFIMRIN